MTSTKRKKKLQRHSGTLGPHRNIDEIIANGKAVEGPFDSLPPGKFEAFVRDEYNVGSRKAQDWIHVARRFADCPDLVRGCAETTIIDFARSSLDNQTIILFISCMQSGKIPSDTRYAKKEIRKWKKSGIPEYIQNRPINTNPHPPPIEAISQKMLSDTVEMKYCAIKTPTYEKLTIKAKLKERLPIEEIPQAQSPLPRTQAWFAKCHRGLRNLLQSP